MAQVVLMYQRMNFPRMAWWSVMVLSPAVRRAKGLIDSLVRVSTWAQQPCLLFLLQKIGAVVPAVLTVTAEGPFKFPRRSKTWMPRALILCPSK